MATGRLTCHYAVCHWDDDYIKEADGYETKEQTKAGIVTYCRSTLYLCCECSSQRYSANLTCLAFLLLSDPSDGRENGLGSTDPVGAVPTQSRADVQALYPQGDHPETDGWQHRRGPLMSQSGSRWLR